MGAGADESSNDRAADLPLTCFPNSPSCSSMPLCLPASSNSRSPAATAGTFLASYSGSSGCMPILSSAQPTLFGRRCPSRQGALDILRNVERPVHRGVPSPTIADAIHGGCELFEVRCKKCGRGDSVDLTDVVWPRDNPVHTLDRALGCRQCKTERRADLRPDPSLCGCTNRRTQHRDRR